MKILFIFAFLISSFQAQAATYNFFFNNTEQGDNSTASPNVTVQDGKKVDGAEGSSISVLEKNAPGSAFSKFRFTVGYASTDNDMYTYPAKKRGSLFSVAYTLSREFGISALLGRLWGPELEFFIVRNEPIGMNFSLLFGALTDTRNVPQKISASFGAQATYYVARHFGIHASIRSNMLSDRYKGPTTSAGLSLLF